MDWLADLREFAPMVVANACGEWRRSQTRKPSIADIYKLCREEQGLKRSQPQYTQLDGRSDPYAAREAYAKSAGFSSWLEREDAIAAQQGRYERAAAWRAENSRVSAVPGFVSAAAALGVTAREYTPSEMSASRQQLGIEE